MSKPEITNAIDWLSVAERAFAALAAEHAADRKAFYRTNYGAERARAAIAAHQDLARRYQQFNIV